MPSFTKNFDLIKLYCISELTNMANRTVKDAVTVKGTNPQYLVEKIIRSRIYDSKYWKENCFALTAELMVDKAMELRYDFQELCTVLEKLIKY